MLAAVDHYEQSELSPVQQAALRLADAYLIVARGDERGGQTSLADHLSPEQAVELVLKLMGFSSDKVMVALGLDFDEINVFTM